MSDESSNESEALSDYGPDNCESLQLPTANSKPKQVQNKRYVQQFRDKWLQDPNFKDWLVRPSPGKSSATCRACQKPVSCLKSSLLRHSKSEIHKKAMKSRQPGQQQGNLVQCFRRQEENSLFKETFEVRVCAFLAEHNLPLSLIGPLVSLFKSTAPVNSKEAEVLKGIHLSTTRYTNILRQGLGLYFSKELVQILRDTYFSIIPDETTDVATEKQLGICVVYFDELTVQPVTRFFDMVEVETATAVGLYNAIKSSFEEKKIPIKNIIGYSSDTTNVMFGEHQSVVSLLKKDAPYVLAVKCSCHMIHLCASYACLKMSTTLEDLCRNIYSYFNRSSLRQHEFHEFQEFVETKPHKLLGIGQTRWLSLESCVRRVLEQWDALRLYFTSVVNEKKDPSYTTESILKGLSNKYLKAQLEFLSFQLHRLNDFNTLFQSSDPVLHHVRDEVHKLLKCILSDFMKIDVVKSCDPFTVPLDDPINNVHVDQVYVGILATTTLHECHEIDQDPRAVKSVKMTCLEFMMEAVKQIRSRFDLSDSAYKLVEFVLPENAVKCCPPSLQELFIKFPYLTGVADKMLVDAEWRKQALEESSEINKDESSLQFWQNRLSTRTFDGKLKYANLMKVIGCIMSIPSSNAAVERLFSLLKLVKTDTRNSLKRESLVGLLHTKEGLRAESCRAHDLKTNPELLTLLRAVKSNATDSAANQRNLLQLSSQ